MTGASFKDRNFSPLLCKVSGNVRELVCLCCQSTPKPGLRYCFPKQVQISPAVKLTSSEMQTGVLGRAAEREPAGEEQPLGPQAPRVAQQSEHGFSPLGEVLNKMGLQRHEVGKGRRLPRGSAAGELQSSKRKLSTSCI